MDGGSMDGVSMDGEDVTLEPFRAAHLELLDRWLHAPHVARWYAQPDEDLARAAEPPEGGAQALICDRGRPVGYLRWQSAGRELLDSLGLDDIPAGAVDIDILLGETDGVGRGIGPRALQLLVDRLRRDPTIPMLGLTSELANHRAHRAFERAGFRIDREYEAGSLGRCYLLLMELRRDGAA